MLCFICFVLLNIGSTTGHYTLSSAFLNLSLVNDNTAEIRKIQPGESIGQRIEVISGLEAGNVVVVRGNERLAPGQPVQIAEPQ